ncbi:MAG: BadF/BadG/BcrA/BcrD ATPase family protein [Sulfolobales archaeon]
MKDIVLGIDSGASKIEIAVVNPDGILIEIFRHDRPGNPASIGLERSLKNLSKALARTLEKIPRERIVCVGIGMAGYLEGLWDEHIKRELAKMLDPETRVEVFEDIRAAHASAHLLGDGVIGILGTGSNFYGVCGGRSWRVGGWGHLIDDRGGAYSIGARALSMVVKSLDGRIGKTVLTTYSFQHYNVSDAHQLVSKIYSSEDPKGLIASFAPYVFKAYMEGDPVAVEIIGEEVREVALSITTILKKLECPEIPISLTGSIYRANKALLKDLLEMEVGRMIGRSVVIGDQRIRESCASALIMLKLIIRELDENTIKNLIRTCTWH